MRTPKRVYLVNWADKQRGTYTSVLTSRASAIRDARLRVDHGHRHVHVLCYTLGPQPVPRVVWEAR